MVPPRLIRLLLILALPAAPLVAHAQRKVTVNASNQLVEPTASQFRSANGIGTSSFSGAFTDLTARPTTLGGYGITDAQGLNASLTALAGNTATSINDNHVTLTLAGVIGDGSGLTALNAGNLASGTVPTARLGSGTANSTTFLRGDGSWSSVAAGIDAAATFTANRFWDTGTFTLTIGGLAIAPAQISTQGVAFTTDGGNIDLGGGIVFNGAVWNTFTTRTANYSVGALDDVVYVDATSNDVTITLPTPASATVVATPGNGYSRCFRIKRIDTSSHTASVVASGGALMDTYSTINLAPWQSIDLKSNGTLYLIH